MAKSMPEQLPHLHGRLLASSVFDAACHEWIFTFSGQCVLRVAAPWRIVSNGQIVVGHADDGQWFGVKEPFDAPERVMQAVAGQGITEVSLSDFGDLTIRFGVGPTLQVFNGSAGYEGWQLSGPGERTLVAQGGGRVSDSDDKAGWPTRHT